MAVNVRDCNRKCATELPRFLIRYFEFLSECILDIEFRFFSCMDVDTKNVISPCVVLEGNRVMGSALGYGSC